MGRPKGSKNKPKVPLAEAAPIEVKRRGRPPGSKSKLKSPVTVTPPDTVKAAVEAPAPVDEVDLSALGIKVRVSKVDYNPYRIPGATGTDYLVSLDGKVDIPWTSPHTDKAAILSGLLAYLRGALEPDQGKWAKANGYPNTNSVESRIISTDFTVARQRVTAVQKANLGRLLAKDAVRPDPPPAPTPPRDTPKALGPPAAPVPAPPPTKVPTPKPPPPATPQVAPQVAPQVLPKVLPKGPPSAAPATIPAGKITTGLFD